MIQISKTSLPLTLLLTLATAEHAICQSTDSTVNHSLLRVRKPTAQEIQRRLTPRTRAVQEAMKGIAHVFVKFLRTKSRRGFGQHDSTGGKGKFVKVERPTSGVILSAKGLVVTNLHLVAEALGAAGKRSKDFWLEAVLSDGRSFAAKIIAKDERLDLALLELRLAENERVPFVTLGDSAKVRPGEPVIAVGHPEAKAYFAFAGCVAFANGPVELRGKLLDKNEVFLSDAPLLAQMDGAALLNRFGHVLGICNPSHILPRKAEPTEEDLRKPDYAVVITTESMRKAFGKKLDSASLASSSPAKSGAAATESDMAAAGIVHRLRDSIVSIFVGAKDERPKQPAPTDPYAKSIVKGLGSGVIVDKTGLVLTNAHIVGAASSSVFVTLRSGKTYKGEVLHRRRHGNTALIKLDLPGGKELPSLDLGDSSAGMLGETVVLLGNPYGHTSTVAVGFLSSLDRLGQLQLSARVHSGLSGGALVDLTGRLIGIINAPPGIVHMRGNDPIRETGIAFATPIDKIRKWYRDDFTKYASAMSLHVAPSISSAEKKLRSSAISRVVEQTRNSLLNVYIEIALGGAPKGFNPFGESKKRFRRVGMGSGVIIDRTGLAITNWHVVDAVTRRGGEQRKDHGISVSLPNGKTYEAKVLSTSRDDDLALIKLVLADGETVTPIALGDSDALLVGERVVAIGNPFGQANTVTVGVVSAKDRSLAIKGRVRLYRGLIRTDAGINPGNSGGALLDLNGHLVGINSAGSGWSGGNGFAIPVNHVRNTFRNKLLSAERLRSAFVGLIARDVDGHVVVSSVNPFGPAARAGIKRQDRIVSVGGKKLSSSIDFVQMLLAAKAGEPITLQIERDGERLVKKAIPLSNAVWKIFRQSGIEVTPVDYRRQSELVRAASVALHRKYSGDSTGQPMELMVGALRVVQVHPGEQKRGLDIRADDLLLGVSMQIEDVHTKRTELVRFQKLADVSRSFDSLAKYEAQNWECWVFRDGKIRQVWVPVLKVR